MDLKSDDIFNIQLDSALLKSYELDDELSSEIGKLNLGSMPNDIFEFSEVVPKKEVDSDAEERANDAARDEDISKLPPEDDKSEVIKTELNHSRIQKRKKDINGNDRPASDENIHCLLQGLVIKEDSAPSDSDNETNEEASKLKERAPTRSRRRANRSRYENNVLGRNENCSNVDRGQFNGERLRFLSGGSSHIQFNDAIAVSQFAYSGDLNCTKNNEGLTTFSSQDSLFEDIRASGVSSPESGYDSSITGSPPRPFSLNLVLIPETVDEQNILDFLAENTEDCALLPDLNLESKDDEDKINNIISYLLKDTPVERNESVCSRPSSECSLVEHMPLVRSAPELNTVPVPSLLPVTTNSGVKSTDTPKKIVYKKLDDKAKKALQAFLVKDKIRETQKKIYQRIQEDRDNEREIRVICVVDEADKGSENRTNLHYAVLNSKVEDIFCLVEIHKQYNKPFTDINIRDKYGKTALDYAIKNKMTLVIDYLKENTACQSVHI